MPKLRLNISAKVGFEEKVRILLGTQNNMVSNLRVVGYDED